MINSLQCNDEDQQLTVISNFHFPNDNGKNNNNNYYNNNDNNNDDRDS